MFEQRFNRRDALKAIAAGTIASSLWDWMPGMATHALATENRAERPKACILLWMTGGPSQLDTFDMKPDGPADSRGEFRPIDTAVSGIRICELLPKTAQQMRHIAILGSVVALRCSFGLPRGRFLLVKAVEKFNDFGGDFLLLYGRLALLGSYQ